MDVFLNRVTQQAMNYAIRSGVTLTASYAIRQSAKLLSTTPKSDVRDELDGLQQRLQHKIRIVSPAIDMIELIAARGHTSLESAVALTKELRLDIQSLGQRLASAAAASEAVARKAHGSAQAQLQHERELRLIVTQIRTLLHRIEDAVPLINLAITTSGASLSTSLPHTVSPSRLLQASTFLTAGDTQYALAPQTAVQIGPTFTLTLYMLFAGHDRPQNEAEIRETTWKEVIHKARVKLRRVPLDVVLATGAGSDALTSASISSPGPASAADPATSLPAQTRSDEFAYQIMMIEDLDDDRVHDFDDDQGAAPGRPGPFDDVRRAGIREMIPIHQISKIFYADTSKVLNIGSDAESNQPVLLLKRDLNALPPRRMLDRDATVDDEDGPPAQPPPTTATTGEPAGYADPMPDPWRLPPSLDPEWVAFEVYTEGEATDSDSEDDDDQGAASTDAATSQMTESLSQLHVSSPGARAQMATEAAPPWVNKIPTSLSLLELLLRLTSLQQFQQQSHLSITDELLNFFLDESATTGAGGDEHYRQALRAEARRRVGWDPYDESPMKRRGEDYQYYDPTPLTQLTGHPATTNGSWSPRDAPPRSLTAASDSRGSPSPSPDPSPSVAAQQAAARGGRKRTSWLRRGSDRRDSPLRSQTVLTDEGLGTSPGSGGDPTAS